MARGGARAGAGRKAGKSANTSPLSRRARARARVETGNQRPWPADKVEAVDAAGVDNVALLGLQQQRQESTGAVIDAAPADVEGPLPFLAAVDDQAAAAAD